MSEISESIPATPGPGGDSGTFSRRGGRREPLAAAPSGPIEGAMPWRPALLLGLGSLAIGVTGPLYDAYVTPFLEERLARSAASGAVMGIDNAMALILTPLFGIWSDRLRTRLGRRVPFVLVALPLAAVGFAAIPFGHRSGSVAALLAAMLIFNLAICAMRAPFQALLSDLVPSRHRSRAYGLMSVMMCVGALVILLASRVLYPIDSRLPFALSGAILLSVFAVFSRWLREPPAQITVEEGAPREPREDAPADAERRALGSIRELVRAADPMLLRFFAGTVFFHVGFQCFSTWFTTYAEDQLEVTRQDAVLGFVVLGLSNGLASMPAGMAGSRFGRRRVVLVGLSGMVASSAALSAVGSLTAAFPLIALLGISWSLALVNLFPMALQIGGPARAATFAGAFFFCQSLAGMFGPGLCGVVFDAVGSKRPLFWIMAASLVFALVLILGLRRGYAEADDAPLLGDARG